MALQTEDMLETEMEILKQTTTKQEHGIALERKKEAQLEIKIDEQ